MFVLRRNMLRVFQDPRFPFVPLFSIANLWEIWEGDPLSMELSDSRFLMILNWLVYRKSCTSCLHFTKIPATSVTLKILLFVNNFVIYMQYFWVKVTYQERLYCVKKRTPTCWLRRLNSKLGFIYRRECSSLAQYCVYSFYSCLRRVSLTLSFSLSVGKPQKNIKNQRNFSEFFL